MILVKLGGSVLTTKGGAKRVRSQVLARLARELAGDQPLVVLHGAGSFGHTLAKKARLREGIQIAKQRHAASQVQADVRTLHNHVLVALQQAGLRPFSLPPGQVAYASGGELQAIAMSPFRLALQQGFTPVTCGDVLLDDKQGVAIVSADTIAEALAAALQAERMVFATDVDGIFTAPPGKRGAKLIDRITPAALRALPLGGSSKTDVTGGMAGKGRAIAAIAELGCGVWVVNGLEPGRVRDAVRGGRPVGTRVALEG
ncbi:MAG TPA: isopentenyl phosphate kinase [Candidatus Thermoplasmatota archaeon]|nr:isopentenyl phosphate kinase [Candidatus Thermoplasmatota archaeon]